MKKNVASQVIGVQMITAADGSAFTGTVTALVTIDGGTQSASGGTGPTHEGNGFHTYLPTQAETNGDHIGFTFTGTGAIPVTVQVYTSFPQTGDNFARLGAPAGASVSADVAAVKAETANILTDTAEIGAAGAGLTALATAAALATVDGNVDAILDDTGTAGVVVAAASKTGYTLSSAGIQAVWDALTSALTTAGSVGKLIVDNVNATISSRMATTHIAATAGKVDGVALVDVTTTNSDMRGTDSANTTTPPTAGAVADAVWDEATAGHTTAGTFGEQLKTDVDAILLDTAEIGAAGAGLTDLGGMSTGMKAEVNAEVVDVVNTDTYAEPGQGAPAATATLAAKINYLYKSWRNKKDNDGTTTKLYADDTTTVDQKQTTGEAGGTVTKGEWASGP